MVWLDFLNYIVQQIRYHNTRETELLNSINYGPWGIDGFGHPGDSESEQYIIWEDKSRAPDKLEIEKKEENVLQ